MNHVHETAYPALPAEVAEGELRTAFTPSDVEIRFVFGQFRQAPTRVLILAQLKLLQRLGYLPPVSDIPAEIIGHVCAVLGVRPVSSTSLTRYDRSGSKSRHHKILLEFVNIRPVNAQTYRWLGTVAADAARTKTELPDIINVLIEELVHHRYELPSLATLSRIAAHARSVLHESIYQAFVDSLDVPLTERLDALFVND